MYVIAVLTRLLRKAHALKFSDGSVPAILLYYRSEALPLPMSVVRLSLRPHVRCVAAFLCVVMPLLCVACRCVACRWVS